MQQKRNKKGQFEPNGESTKPRLHFNSRYVKIKDLEKPPIDDDAIENAYTAGFNANKRAPLSSVKECFKGFLQYGQ